MTLRSCEKCSSSGSGTAYRTAARPFLRAFFACCNVYQRIYRNPDSDRYDGACPRCGKRVRFIVGPDGTNCRSFVIS